MTSEGLRLLQLHFAGAVLGVYVHEANNRLATLQETIGLLGDLLRAAGSGRAEAAKESLRIAAGLEKQVTLLAALNRNLDGFARRLQTTEGTIELPGALDELLSLTARLARQKRVFVEKDFARSVPPLHVEPVTFLLLFHHLLARGYELLQPQGTLRVQTLRQRAATAIGIQLVEFTGSESPADDRGRELARGLGARHGGVARRLGNQSLVPGFGWMSANSKARTAAHRTKERKGRK